MGGKGVIGARIGARIGTAIPGAVSFVGTSDAAFSFPDDPGDSVELTVITPTGVVAGDTMLIFAVTDAGGPAEPTSLPSGWTQIEELHADSETVLFIFRRIAGSEPTNHAIQMQGGAVRVGAMMVVYRGIDTLAALVASAITDCDPDTLPTTDFPCPSLTLAVATDFYIGIVWVVDAAPSVTPPGGTTERFDVSQVSGDLTARRIEIFEFKKGSTGATGTKTATIAAPHSGIAASILLKAAV